MENEEKKLNGFFMVFSLSKNGLERFTYLDKERTTGREIYFIDRIRPGDVTGSTMLLGQFLFEFEKEPEAALPLIPGSTNRIYFPDRRIDSFCMLTKEEINETEKRLTILLEKQPEFENQIKMLLEVVEKHRKFLE